MYLCRSYSPYLIISLSLLSEHYKVQGPLFNPLSISLIVISLPPVCISCHSLIFISLPPSMNLCRSLLFSISYYLSLPPLCTLQGSRTSLQPSLYLSHCYLSSSRLYLLSLSHCYLFTPLYESLSLLFSISYYLSLPPLCKLQGSRTSLQRYFSLSLSHFYSLPPSMNLCRSYSLFTYYLYLSPSILYLSLLYKGSRTSVPTSLSLSVYCCS